MSIFEKFNQEIDTEALKKDIEEVATNAPKTEFKEVADGKYEVAVQKMEAKESSKGHPMLSIQFKILNKCEFKGQFIFYNQLLNNKYGVHKANELLRSLEAVEVVQFNDYVQYEELIYEIYDEIENAKLEYELEYGTNDKGFKTFKITEVYEG